MISKLIRTALYLCCFALTPTFAQPGQQDFQAAVDLYNKGMYAEAQQRIQQIRKETPSTSQTQLANLDYYDIMCAVRLKQANSTSLAEHFLSIYPESNHRNEVTFALALASYANGKYKESAKHFEAVKSAGLNESLRAEYYFKFAHSLYETGKTERAADLFAQVKDSPKSRYAPAATYYYAHIAYENKSYAAALKHFETIKDDPDFASIVPFYMIQIYFHQKEYSKVIEQGDAVFAKASSERAGEVAKILAESNLQLGQYPKALEWFDKFRKTQKDLSLNDTYLIALTYFNLDNYKNSIELLSKVKTTSDTTSQHALYLLGASYIKTGEKEKALTTFEKASKITANKELASEIQLTYAKLLFELKNDSSALKAYIEKNPTSKQDSEVRSFYIQVLTSEKKFQEAIDLIQSSPQLTEKDEQQLQLLAYYNALELYKKGNFSDAKKNIELSLEYDDYDESIASLASYWLAEIHYRAGSYADARKILTRLISTKGSFKHSAEYEMAHYTLAYSYFRESSYADAATWFRKFLALVKNPKTPFAADAYNRIGDCLFKEREFDAASSSYEKALAIKLANPDYSLYQSGLSQGMAGRSAKKKELLESMIKQYPESSFVPAAWFEIGQGYVQNSKYSDAISSFEIITSKYKSSSYYPKALVELGLIKLNQGQDDDALKYYKLVVEKYPESSEAADALVGIKSIYMDKGKMDEYFTLASSLGKGGYESESERDSLIFASAERIYLQEDCARAQEALNGYLTGYPTGKYRLTASYYLGDCLYRTQKYSDCLKPLAYVTEQPNNIYTEDALIRYAKASWELNKYNDAARAFAKVEKITKQEQRVKEAKTGAMRGFYLAKDYPSSSNAATSLLAESGLNEDLTREAQYIKAYSLHQLNQLEDAKKVYEKLAKDPKTAEGAEACYRIAEILFAQGKYDKAEEAIIQFSESKTPYASWLARSFIVLGDVYVKKANYFQARETYKSITSGYKNTEDGILEEVKDRLKSIEGK